MSIKRLWPVGAPRLVRSSSSLEAVENVVEDRLADIGPTEDHEDLNDANLPPVIPERRNNEGETNETEYSLENLPGSSVEKSSATEKHEPSWDREEKCKNEVCPRHGGFLRFIGWRIGNKRRRKLSVEVGLCGDGESKIRKETCVSLPPHGIAPLQRPISERHGLPQQPCCAHGEEAVSQAKDEWPQNWPTDMLNTTIFGSPADFQMLLEVEAAQGLSDKRENRMIQRAIGREIYLQALYGGSHCPSLLLREFHLPSFAGILRRIGSWWGSELCLSNVEVLPPGQEIVVEVDTVELLPVGSDALFGLVRCLGSLIVRILLSEHFHIDLEGVNGNPCEYA